jgi:signal transduction histidine kinase/DNA-binding response OmpR family regulator
MGWALRATSLHAQELSREVSHSLRLLETLSSLEQDVSAAVAAVRGLAITRSPAFAEERDRALAEIDRHLSRVRELARRDAEDVARIAQLEAFLDERLALLREARGDLDRPRIVEEPERLGRIRASEARFFEGVADVRARERKLLADREQLAKSTHTLTMQALGGMAALFLLLVVPGVILYKRAYRGRENALRAAEYAREAAERADRAKSTFLAIMSHEIRTPLNGVLGMLELLSLTRLDGDQRSTLSIVRESGRALQRIIDDILDFSKVEAGRLDLSPVPSSVREVVNSVRNLYAGNASSKGLLLRCSVDPWIGAAHVFDPLRLRQILGNFVSNAIKFTAAGEVEIRVTSLGRDEAAESLLFAVRDTGIGMSGEVQRRLFEPFMQADSGTAREYGGTGLGLTISKRLAEMMGGTVAVGSDANGGTTVTLTLVLPAADGAAAAHLDPPSADDPPVPEQTPTVPTIADAERVGKLVLAVDDHPTNRMLLQRQVNTLGYAAEMAEDGIEALDKWRSRRFALVITDINMPGMTGYELARAIRQIEAEQGRARTPIIACTANALQGEAGKCFEAGMDDYLAKPTALPELAVKLRCWLEEKRSEEGTVPVIDRAVLASMTASDGEVERQVMADFQEVSMQDEQELLHAYERGDVQTVARIAHRIKGASRMVGAVVLAEACESLERLALAQDCGDLSRAMQRLRDELHRVGAYIAGEDRASAL